MNLHKARRLASARNGLRLSACLALVSTALPHLARAEAVEETAPKPVEEEVINMDAFNVQEKAANPYRAEQAVSGSRVAMSIQNIPQTISVVTKELIQDTLGQKMLDVAKYVTPIVESTLPYGGDRYMIRGFQVSHEFIDGIEISGADGYSMSLAQYNIERVEVIKGPNAILVPGGSPGGQMNPITKSPLLKNQSSVTLELAQYMGNAVSTDVNRVINASSGTAVRMVAAVWKNEGYIRHQFRNGYLFAPSFTTRLNPNNKVVVKAEIMQNRETNLGGVPIDPSVGSNNYAFIARGLPRDWSFANDADARHRSTERITGELYTNIDKHISSRLQLIADHVLRRDVGGSGAALASQDPTTGTVTAISYPLNSATGLYVPGTIPATNTWVFTRNNGRVYLNYEEYHLKHDFAAKYETEYFNSTSVAGYSANQSTVHFKSWPSAARPTVSILSLNSITYPDYTWTEPNYVTGTNRTGRQRDGQLFAYENLSFLQDRAQLSGGVSRFRGNLSRTDSTGIGSDPYPHYGLTSTALSLGALVKPIKEVSLFYSYNESGGSMPSSINAGTFAPNMKYSDGNQKEFGVKTSLLKNRLNFSAAHFDIVQSNYGVPNSEYYTLVSQGAVIPADFPTTIYLDLKSKGWEYEGSFAVNENLTLLANYTDFKIRQPGTNVRVRGVPDHAGGFYADYRFHDGAMRGWGFNVGMDYKSNVAGENATGYTSAVVAKQPSFLVAGRTIWNVGVAYREKAYTVRVTLFNALNKDYILAAGSRSSAVVGDPRSVKASYTYNF